MLILEEARRPPQWKLDRAPSTRSRLWAFLDGAGDTHQSVSASTIADNFLLGTFEMPEQRPGSLSSEPCHNSCSIFR